MNPTKMPCVLIGVTIDRSINFHSKLAVALKKEGCDVHMVSSGGPNMAALPKEVGTHCLKMSRNPSPLRDIKSIFQWINLLRKVQPDVVLVGTPKASLLGLLSSKIMNVPTRIYFVHGLRFETVSGPFRSILLAMEKLALTCASRVVVVSPSVRAKILSLGLAKPAEVEVLGMGSTQGLDLDLFRPNRSRYQKTDYQVELGLNPDLPTIGFVGRLTAEKGIAELRDALLNLHANGVQLQALLIGSAEDELGKTVVANLRSNGIRVVAPGQVCDPSPYFRAMDIFCLPTYREGLGNVILEAFASEVPVVSTEVTGVVDLIDHLQTGLLVPARDADALGKAIHLLLSNSVLANSMKMTARKFVVENFDSRVVIEGQKKFVLQQVAAVQS